MEIINLSVKMMATLWENTYRAILTNQDDDYTAAARVIINVPLPPELMPDDAPHVEAEMTVLIEDSLIDPNQIISFETIAAAKLRAQFNYEIINVYFYYPSPISTLSTEEQDEIKNSL